MTDLTALIKDIDITGDNVGKKVNFLEDTDSDNSDYYGSN